MIHKYMDFSHHPLSAHCCHRSQRVFVLSRTGRRLAACNWTVIKRTFCGWPLAVISIDFRLLVWSARPWWHQRQQSVTSESLSMRICRCGRMYNIQSHDASPACVDYAASEVVCRCLCSSSWLLHLSSADWSTVTVCWSAYRPILSNVCSAKCCCATHLLHHTFRPHYRRFDQPPLAMCTRADRL